MFLYWLEIKKIESGSREHIQRIFNDHEKIKLQLENQKIELELKSIELQKREVVSENEQRKLSEEIEQVCVCVCDTFTLSFSR